MLEQLNHDMIYYIIQSCNYKSIIALKSTNLELYYIIKKFTIIQKKLEEKFKFQFNLYSTLTFENSQLHMCLNSKCVNKNEFIQYYSKKINLNKCMGLTRFYFPKHLTPNNIPLNLQNIKAKFIECKKAKKITQFIHYCEDCMTEYILPIYNYSIKNRLVEIPYGDDIDIFNIEYVNI